MALRMVELTIAAADAPEPGEWADDGAVTGVWREPLDDDLVLLRVLVHGERTESVLNDLESRFQHRRGFRLVIFEVQATVPAPSPLDEEVPPADGQKPEEPKDPRRIACAELVQDLTDGLAVNRIFLLTIVLSTIVAAIGLVRDNVAVIIGAMVIAPLLGPNMALALATTLGDAKLAKRALRVNASGMALAFALSCILGACVSFDPTLREIAGRTEVSLSDIILALAAGSAGALAFTTGLSAALVGVMVAVALLPPLATTGLLLGAGEWRLAYGALMLLAANVVCINLAGVGTFLYQGIRPRHWWEAERAKRMVRVSAVVWCCLLLLLIVLIVLGQRAA